MNQGLPDGARHVLATAAAAAGFLGLYLGLKLSPWAALVLAAGLYAGFLALIPTRKAPSEIFVADHVSAADLQEARRKLGEASERLRAAASGALRVEDRGLAESLAGRVEELERILNEDPSDLRALRRFIAVFLPRMVESMESFLRLGRSGDPALESRISVLREQIAAYPAAVDSLGRAALSKDLTLLEAEVEALSFQIRR
ncbi:5-bromo-4-chloroindolyl phosphate hydrolysis family protein [Neomegalonema sp.]|uniref:5-bromo-4-chloroindolyl phosphate hydrolysis family protein n=1 Tax=Neomegalonema sp. TaxID=2039713 RepID=UPI002610C321|nr:5-bromo-4-chloroindolyl phosphate hydrolysis family protein [Neomegalonema sp.]MDD2867379.1 5-bromo-4-chloroindolyl phosphate hydrolysis family protein [Neomegalonema sp.]